MRKWGILLIGLLIILTSCSASSNSSATAKTAKQAPNHSQASSTKASNSMGTSDASSTAAGSGASFPLTKKKITLKVLAVKSNFVQDYDTNEFTKWYEQKTNVHIDWQFATPQEAQQKLNLVLNSGDLPDMIIGFNVSPAQQMAYGQQGIFMPLNKMIDKYGVETKKLFAKYPEVKEATTAPDGNIYSLSTIDRNPHAQMPQKMWINTDWLKKLNLPMPTTTDEFYKVLKAFKTEDPNGNGKADEIPMAGAIQNPDNSVTSFLMNSFILNDLKANQLIFDKDGSIDVNFNKPGWKQGLQYLHKLYADHLIAPESFTQNSDQLKAMVEGGNVPTVGVISATIPQQFSDIAGKRWLQYKTVPPLKGPTGLQQSPYAYYGFVGGQLLITSACKNPDIAFKWADALFNQDVSRRANIGPEGEGWRKAKPGEIGLNGKPATWVRLLQFGNVQNIDWEQTTPYYFSAQMWGELAAGPNDIPRVLYEETMKNYEPYKDKKSQTVPPIFFSESQSAELSDLQKTIMDYVNQMTTRFIIGDASLDKDWDKYVSTLNSMNLKRYLQIYNEAYKTQYKK